MRSWQDRAIEERAFLSPSFCSVLLWASARGYQSSIERGMPLSLTFLVLPMVLNREARESLPRSVATSFPVWAHEAPLQKATAGNLAVSLAGHTREALLFGARHGLFAITAETVAPLNTLSKPITRGVRELSDEGQFCFKRAEFLGRWFAQAGAENAILSIVGVQP